MSRLVYETECDTCDGTGDEVDIVPVGHFVHRPCRDCEGSGGSRTPLNPVVFIGPIRMDLMYHENGVGWWIRPQDVLDALED